MFVAGDVVRRTLGCAAVLGLGLLGCQSEGTFVELGEGSTGDVAASSESGSSDDGSMGEGGVRQVPERLDVPQVEEELGCRKIDFLFVIDDSDSMADEQQQLIDGFPGFLESVRDTIEDFDYHVMVVGTGRQEMSFDPCENRFGTGHVRSSKGEDCGLLEDFLNGERFIDAEHEDVEAAFACIADVGVDGGGDEKTVWSLGDAITEHTGVGQCNEGFLRDDAILVITLITDEEDDPNDGPPRADNDGNSPGDPAYWREGMLEAKHGDDEAIVVLGLLGDSDVPGGLCSTFVWPEGEGAEPSPRLRELVESFPYGSWTSVCQPDYSTFFNAAVGDIDAACGGFSPPG
jgi:hypothetical protein